MKTSELTGAALDWAVEIASGGYPQWNTEWEMFYAANGAEMHYSTDWAQGGPIIEREHIETSRGGAYAEHFWKATRNLNTAFGTTPLVAAMRCFVASKLGDTVDIPEELL